MRIAFCLHGIVGGFGGKNSKQDQEKVLDLGFNYHRENIFEPNISAGHDIDIFIHSWTNELHDKICDLYSPSNIHTEEQIYFDTSPLIQKGKKDEPKRSNNHYSKWYSLSQSIKAKNEYKLESGKTYDYVMSSRFDIAWQKPLLFDDFDENSIYLPHLCVMKQKNKSKQLNIRNPVDYWSSHDSVDLSEYDHTHPGWPNRKRSWGFWDCWFISNEKNMDLFEHTFSDIDFHLNDCKNLRSAFSNHLITELHFEKYKLLNNIKFHTHCITDCPIVRSWHS